MNCIFKRDGEYLKCECCGVSIKTVSDKVKMNCKGGEGCTKPEYPSVFQMAVNATTAAINYVADGMTNASEEEIKKRLEICEACPLFDAVQRRCTRCGCFVSIKTTARSSKCPEDKW